MANIDFVAQFDALRMAHAVLECRGENATTLGQLVRGYAQLAILIHYHWNCSADVCQARSLIFAERLLRLEPDGELAR